MHAARIGPPHPRRREKPRPDPSQVVPYGSTRPRSRSTPLTRGGRRGAWCSCRPSRRPPPAKARRRSRSASRRAWRDRPAGRLALREPSLGPTFGLKGGATGGGKSIVVPDERHQPAFHRRLPRHHLGAQPARLAGRQSPPARQRARHRLARRVLWRRVIDLNDRALRDVVIGLGGAGEGVPRETGFDITPASEIMAALCLAEGRRSARPSRAPDRRPARPTARR